MSGDEEKRMLTRSDILGASDLKHDLVKVPEWGGAVRIKTLSGRERHAFQAIVSKLKNPEEIVEHMLVVSMVDEENNQLFSYADVKELGEKSARALNRVFRAAARLNGMTKDGIEDAMGE